MQNRAEHQISSKPFQATAENQRAQRHHYSPRFAVNKPLEKRAEAKGGGASTLCAGSPCGFGAPIILSQIMGA